MTKSELLGIMDKAISGDASQARAMWGICNSKENAAKDEGETAIKDEFYTLGNCWMILTGDIDSVTPAMQEYVRREIKQDTLKAFSSMLGLQNW